MAINATQVTNTQTLEQLRSQFNNLVTDVSALENGTLNFGQVSATNISVGDLSITGSLGITTVSPTELNILSDRITFEGTGNVQNRIGYSGTAATKIPVTLPATIYRLADSNANRVQLYGAADDSSATVTSMSVKLVNGNTGTLA